MNTDTIRLLVAKGLSAEDILEIAETLDQPKPKSAAAKRQERYRQRKKGVTNDVTRDAMRDVTAPPNEIYSNPPVNPVSANADTPPLPVRVVDAWNAGPGAAGAHSAKPMDEGRRRALAARVKAHGEEAVFEAIRNLAGSDWHTGKGSSGWKANLGWLLKPENFLKALEMGAPRPPPSPSNDLYEQARRYAPQPQPH